MLLIVEVTAGEGIYLTAAACEPAPAVHIHALHKGVLLTVKHGYIAAEGDVLGGSAVTLSHADIGAEDTVEGPHQLLVGDGSGCGQGVCREIGNYLLICGFLNVLEAVNVLIGRIFAREEDVLWKRQTLFLSLPYQLCDQYRTHAVAEKCVVLSEQLRMLFYEILRAALYCVEERLRGACKAS